VRQNNFIISQRFNELRQTPLGEALETVILSAFLALLIKAFVIQAYFIPSGSMIATLEPFDHIVAEKISIRFVRPSRGEIVIFNLDKSLSHSAGISNFEPHREYVKRVIGIGGDRIAMRNGKAIINGIELKEPYLYMDEPRSDDASMNFALILDGKKLRFKSEQVFIDGKPLEKNLPSSIPLSAIKDITSSNIVQLKDDRIGIRSIVVPKGKYYCLGDNRLESADSRYFGFVDESGIEARAIMIYWPIKRVDWI